MKIVKYKKGMQLKTVNDIYNPQNDQVNHNYNEELWGTLVIY
jgi:hypothetical protein